MNDGTVECPYCGEDVVIDHYDGGGYDECMFHGKECEHCDKAFVYTVSYDGYKADCLNGGEHIWKAGYRCMNMECKTCGQERALTTEELEGFKRGRKNK